MVRTKAMTLKEFIETVEKDPNELFEAHNANEYIPITRKAVICNIATQGVDDTPPALIDYDDTGYATVDSVNKMLYMTMTYLVEYFNVDVENFSIDEYDSLYKSGTMSKIDRLAERGSNSKWKKTVCAIQDDFRALEKMLNREIANALGRINDPYKRIMQRMTDDLTPEAMQNGVEELKTVLDEIEQHKNKKQQ